jgi:inner membrane protein
MAVGTLFPPQAVRWRIMLLCAVCSVVPDIDSLGFRLGIPYGHWLGHRGFFHGIPFAVIAAMTATFFIRDMERSMKRRLALFSAFFACILAHDILDAMTNGGLGVAFFSPVSDGRFFLPWRPIEVSPLSPRRLFTPRGAAVMMSEFVWVIIPALLIAAAVFFIRKLPVRRQSSAKETADNRSGQ